jgi:hypothetical protein
VGKKAHEYGWVGDTPGTHDAAAAAEAVSHPNLPKESRADCEAQDYSRSTAPVAR